MSGVENINKDLSILKEKMDLLEKKVDRILELMENDCKKMRDHIDFVENVYDNVKTPFNYVMNSVGSLMSINNLITNVKPPEAISNGKEDEDDDELLHLS
jgi:hypothetical protein